MMSTTQSCEFACAVIALNGDVIWHPVLPALLGLPSGGEEGGELVEHHLRAAGLHAAHHSTVTECYPSCLKTKVLFSLFSNQRREIFSELFVTCSSNILLKHTSFNPKGDYYFKGKSPWSLLEIFKCAGSPFCTISRLLSNCKSLSYEIVLCDGCSIGVLNVLRLFTTDSLHWIFDLLVLTYQ